MPVRTVACDDDLPHHDAGLLRIWNGRPPRVSACVERRRRWLVLYARAQLRARLAPLCAPSWSLTRMSTWNSPDGQLIDPRECAAPGVRSAQHSLEVARVRKLRMRISNAAIRLAGEAVRGEWESPFSQATNFASDQMKHLLRC